MRKDQDFVWGSWAGMGTRPLPFSIQQRKRRRIKLWLWLAVVVFVIGCGLAGLRWNGPQL